MEASFHVRLIATFEPDLATAPADADVVSWLAANHPDFDQFPVRQGGTTVGVLLRQGEVSGKSVRQRMHPLSEELIVSADMPLADLIPLLRENHFRLVLRGNRLDGLVTQSDFLKLPVRMMLFGLITHLELCLRALIRQRRPLPNWLTGLDPKRRREIGKSQLKLIRARFEPDALEFTNFSDVVQVLSNEADLGELFAGELREIKDLRNDIAHAKTFVGSPEEVAAFVQRFERLQKWIGKITELLKDRQ